MTKRRERIYPYILAAFAAVAVMAVVLIFVFVAGSGWQVFARVGVGPFLFGRVWYPTRGHFGLLPLIAGTVCVMFGALLLGVPTGVTTAIFLSEYCPPRLASLLRPAVDLLAGIPSVIYGFFAIISILPLIGSHLGGTGHGVLAGSIVLAIMILPTIASVSRDALEAVPRDYRLGGLALGATHWRTTYNVVVPAAKSGIITAVILGMGRAVGETMAVVMVIGNAPEFPTSLSKPVSALTSTIALDMGYASGMHRTALFGIGIILLVLTMGLVGLGRLSVRSRSAKGTSG